MDALYAMQLDLQKQISNAFTNFKKKGAAKMNCITAQARLAGLEDCYTQFKINHNRILSGKDIPKDHEYFVSNLSEQILDAYFDRKGEFLQFIEDAKQIELERNPPQNVTLQGEHNITINPASFEAHSLPKMNLPKFSGRFSEWENFRDLFRSVVHRRTDLDASIKYYYLRTNLTGEAMEQIKSIPIAGEQYERAWNALVQYYDNKRRTVSTLVASILNIKPMKVESQAELKRVSREFYSPLESLKKLERSDAEIGNDLLVHIVVELFDNSTKKEWKKSIDKSNNSPPTIDQLKTFIQGQIENLDDGKECLNNSSKTKAVKAKQSKGDDESNTVHSLQTSSKESQSKNTSCILCSAEHNLSKCEQFTKKTVADRREFARDKRICFNCLSSGHPKNRCKSRFNCFTCKARHHTLLHIDSPNTEQADSVQSAVQSASQGTSYANAVTSEIATTHTTRVTIDSGVLLATALICVIGPKNKQLTVRALIDPCSQISLITENLCNQLALAQSEARVYVQGVGEQESLFARKMAHFKLTPHFASAYCLETSALVLPKLTAYKPPILRRLESFSHLNGLQLADPRYLNSTRIDVLLGADVYTEIIEEKIVRGTVHQPIAMSSKLGWLLTGKCSGVVSSSTSQTLNLSVLHCSSAEITNTHLHDLLQEFWRAEELPNVKNSCTDEEKACEELFLNTTYRDETGRYIVRLPWKNKEYAEKVKLGNSFPHALRALKRLETNFQKDKNLEAEHKKFMKEYLDLGHMTVIEGQEPSSYSNNYFLPHHGVWKETSSTTKLRTVFNGSSKFSSNESLNDLLYSGPNLLSHPVDPVCTIRNYKIALSADVEKMFRQIGVDPRDRRFQTIIWRLTPLERIQMCILNTVTYGLTSSSYLALRTLLQMANDHEPEHPIAAEIVRKEMYSDNVLTGAHFLEEAVDRISDLIGLFSKARMNLRKWCSNEPKALSALPENMLEENNVTVFNQSSSIPLLGIAWHTSGDHFAFHLDSITLANPMTKRSVLSCIARIFDPLGWIAPVTIVAKVLMQSLWLLKLDWDNPLPLEICERWSRWVADLPSISSIRIPRWTGYTPGTKVEVHGFADASKTAYGAVLYLRLLRDSKVLISLQLAKSKVAPVKTLSIPRLELCACLLLTRLAKRFIDNTKLEISDIHLWTDSADVLFWLRDHPPRWHVFIANRCDWSKAQDDLNFKVTNLVNVVNSRTRSTSSDRNGDSALALCPLDRYSSLFKLLRVTSYALRFITKLSVRLRAKKDRPFSVLHLPFLQGKAESSSLDVDYTELENAQHFCCYTVQRTLLNDEYTLLLNGKRLNIKNPLAALNLMIQNHLIRVGGRLVNALTSYSTKHPIILPHNCALSTLFVPQAHLRTLHGGTQLTLATLRQQVWVLRGRLEVKKVILACTQCAKYAAQIPAQLMGDLPAARVRPAHPFEKTRGKGTLKGFICVFICMVTRAVHLELVEDYTSETFIAAFHRFTARRGHCKELRSDRGTNFVGADSQLKSMLRKGSAFLTEVSGELTKAGTEWRFNPPSAPHFGGLWEAAVKSLKYHLRRVMGCQVLTFSELATLLCRIEACLNSRPLIGISDDPSDLNFLTPAHFLIQRASYLIPEPDMMTSNVPIGKRWQLVSQMAHHFWLRWKNEYLTALQRRNKWLRPKPSPNIGDIVLLRNENTPPGKWPLGKITALHPGADGLVRIVTVASNNGTLKRPIVKLVFLPTDDDSLL